MQVEANQNLTPPIVGMLDPETREKSVYLAKLAEQAERYDGTFVFYVKAFLKSVF